VLASSPSFTVASPEDVLDQEAARNTTGLQSVTGHPRINVVLLHFVVHNSTSINVSGFFTQTRHSGLSQRI
jgi:hypothetical protein